MKKQVVLAKTLFPELDSFWAEWLFKKENSNNEKTVIINKVAELLKREGIKYGGN